MTIVIVGSNALVTHIPTIKVGLDMIMSYETYKEYVAECKKQCEIDNIYPTSKGKKIVIKFSDGIVDEIEIAWPGSTAEEFMNLVLSDPKTHHRIKDVYTPSLDALYAMKMSHRYLRNSPHFKKTMDHIIYMRNLGGAGIDVDFYWQDWYVRRMHETYDYGHPSLDTTKNSFFKEEPFYKYDHDDIHQAVKLWLEPAYTYILADGSPVKCDKNKFNALSIQGKLNCALEECYTLTLERSLIPNDFKPNAKKAFDVALMKVCTSVTSGWFREWCWENYYMINSRFDGFFVGKFLDALDDGKIRPFSHDRSY